MLSFCEILIFFNHCFQVLNGQPNQMMKSRYEKWLFKVTHINFIFTSISKN